jgi:hypothetical protein
LWFDFLLRYFYSFLFILIGGKFSSSALACKMFVSDRNLSTFFLLRKVQDINVGASFFRQDFLLFFFR